jgi:hypothetical protein
MMEPAAGLVAWLLSFQPPHPGSLCGRGWPRAVWKGLIQFYRMAEKKNLVNSMIYFSFYQSFNSIAAKMMDLYPTMLSLHLCPSSIPPSIMYTCFWLVVVWVSLIGGRQKPRCFLY